MLLGVEPARLETMHLLRTYQRLLDFQPHPAAKYLGRRFAGAGRHIMWSNRRASITRSNLRPFLKANEKLCSNCMLGQEDTTQNCCISLRMHSGALYRNHSNTLHQPRPDAPWDQMRGVLTYAFEVSSQGERKHRTK